MYKHIAKSSKAEIIIKKSRFIGHCKYIISKEEAIEFIDDIKKNYYDATHNCYAYISDEKGNELKFSDDGEPGGTAGMPILDVLRNKNLVKTVVVVTRYFGGIKLGAGGLVRAYTEATVKALEKAKVVVEDDAVYFDLLIDYSLLKPIQNSLEKKDNIEILNIDYSDNVTLHLVSKESDFEGIKNKLIDISHGKSILNETKRDYFAFQE